MAQSLWGKTGSHGNLGLLIVAVNEESGVRGGVKGGLAVHKRHHGSWNGF